MKLIAALALLVAVQAQEPLPPLPYNQVLDTNFKVSWGVTSDSVEIQLDVNARGWVSFGIVSDDGKMLDVWWGGYDEDYGLAYGQDGFAEYTNLQPGPRYPDTLQDLRLVAINQSPFNGTTRIRFSRLFSTPDYKQDVSIPFNTRQIIVWSYANADLPENPAAAQGLVQMVLRPA